MHVFLSDLHMTDWDFGSPVTDGELTQFCTNELAKLCEVDTVKLVLLGDVVDLLRSPSWSVIWKEHQAAPWKGAGKNFKNFVGNYSEVCAIQVAQGIRAKYPQFSGALKALVKKGQLSVTYIYGNHDYIAQLSLKVREILCDFLALSNQPSKPFPSAYADEAAGVYATHGHVYDPVNWHRGALGYWAFGDAIVLRIVNRFAVEACAALATSENTLLGQQLHEIDNIASAIDIPVYVRWLTDKVLANAKERKTVLDVWSRVVKDLLAEDHFKDRNGFSARVYSNLRKALSISTSGTLTNLVTYVSSLLPKGTDYQKEADKLAKAQRKYRVIVFGHTHDPKVVPISHTVRDEPGFYVNTGCWRRVVSRPSMSVPGPFVGAREACVFKVHGSASSNPMGRYQLNRLWHVS